MNTIERSNDLAKDEEDYDDDDSEIDDQEKNNASDLESDNDDNDNDDLEEYDSDVNQEANSDDEEGAGFFDSGDIGDVFNKQAEGNKDEYDEDEDDDDDGNDENYLQKFDSELRQEYIVNSHPESLSHNYEEIKELSKIVRVNNVIVDEFHKTLPILTKYERTRVLGQRAKQINNGVKPLIKVSENILDGYIIAEMELKEKKIPFIIRRPLPNGGLEYWKLEDLEIL